MADGMGFFSRVGLALRTARGRLTLNDAKALVGTFDQDAATAAYGLLGKIFSGSSGEPPKRGTKEYLEAFSTSPMLRAVVERISQRMATTQWQLYARKKGGGRAVRDLNWQQGDAPTRRKIRKDLQRTGELRTIEEHPWLDAMNRGNSMLTGYAVRFLASTYAELVGENYWLKQRNAAGVPSAFWPIPPHWIVETPTPTRRVFRASHRSWLADIPDTDMLWWTVPDPANPYGRGSGMARALADELDTDEFVSKTTSSFFYNRAAPNLMVFGEGLDKELAAQLEKRWSAKYLNKPENSGRPFFTNTKLSVTEVGKTFKDMELVDLRKFERDMVIQTFGVPPEIMGVVENSNRATIDAADHLMALNVIQPRLEALRQVFQERLIPEYDDRLVVEYVSPVQEDKEFKLRAMQANTSMFTVDEWREVAGFPEKEDGSGKVHLVSFNLIPAPRLDVPPDTPEPTLEGEPSPNEGEEAEEDTPEDDDADDASESEKLWAALFERSEVRAAQRNDQHAALTAKALEAVTAVHARDTAVQSAAIEALAKVGQPSQVTMPDVHVTVDAKPAATRAVSPVRDASGAIVRYDLTPETNA